MSYSCGLGPHLTGSLRRGPSVRRSLSTAKHIGGVDWHLRTQFTDQLKCLDLKLDIDCIVLADLQEFYRRLASVEQDYADALVKLTNNLKQRHTNEISRRPHWTEYTITSICNTLLGSTLHVAETHSTMADIFAKQMTQRLSDMEEDAVRLHKQCREMMITCQERVLADILRLQSDQREYAGRHAAALEAERVCRRTEEKLAVAQQKASSKGKEQVKSQRCQRAQLEYSQKKEVFDNATMATSKARNSYLIGLVATNCSILRYFTEETDDIADLLTCGFHNSLARSAMMHLSCVESLKTRHSSVVEVLGRNISALDWRKDKACFFKSNENSFARPSLLPFVACKEDAENQLIANGSLRLDLESQAHLLSSEIETTKSSIDFTCRALEDVEKRLLELINQKDYDVSQQFRGHKQSQRSGNPAATASALNGNPGGSTAGGGHAVISSTTSSGSLNSFSTPSGAQRTGSPHRGLHPPSPSGQTAGSGDHLVGGRNRLQPSGASTFLDCRALCRDRRIDQERLYLDIFSRYTDEMHKCQVLQAKLAEICPVIGIQSVNPQGVQCPGGRGFQPGGAVGESTASSLPPASSLRYGAVPVLPTSPMQSITAAAGSASPQLSESHGCQPTAATLAPSPATDESAAPSSPTPLGSSAATAVQKPPARRVLRVPNVGKPKLFGGTIDEYVEATGQTIPRILLSCARIISEFGIHQQGIFRVSGSQAEINEFKQAFERGEDPLMDLREPRDIHSTIGVLKLYFRDLGEPPFSAAIFHELLDCIRDRSDLDETLRRIRQVISQGLSRPVFIVMRYLFAFLNHMTEHSDENLMDAHNLAICFGPTLMPIPADLNPVHLQAMVIELIRTFIAHHTRVFDVLVPGPTYNRQGVGEALSRSQYPEPVSSEADRSSCASLLDSRPGDRLKRMASEVAELAHQRMHRTVSAGGASKAAVLDQGPEAPQPVTARLTLPAKSSDTPATCSDKSSSVDNLMDTRRSNELLSSNDDGLGKEVDNSCDDLSMSDCEVSVCEPSLTTDLVATAAWSPSTEASHSGGGLAGVHSLKPLPEDDLLLGEEVVPSEQPLTHGVCDAHGEEAWSTSRATKDFDSAIDEVVRGLNSLEEQQQGEEEEEYSYRTVERNRQLTQKLCLPLAKHTPDLVLDLLTASTKPGAITRAERVEPGRKWALEPHPDLASPGSPCPATTRLAGKPARGGGDSAGDAAMAMTSGADTFAEQSLDTMRKRPESVATFRSRERDPVETGVGGPARAGGSLPRPQETKATTPSSVDAPATFSAAATRVKTPPNVPPRSVSHPTGHADSPGTTTTAAAACDVPALKESSPDQPSQRLSIAARVAAFEASSGTQSARPNLTPKPRKF